MGGAFLHTLERPPLFLLSFASSCLAFACGLADARVSFVYCGFHFTFFSWGAVECDHCERVAGVRLVFDRILAF